jgi:molybdenum transport protein
MIHFTHAEIDHLITEDLPLHDETTRALGVPDVSGTLTYVARQPGVLAGLKPCLLMAQHLGLRAEALAQDGSALQAQQPVLRLHGGAHALHVAWKQGMNVLEYLGGIRVGKAAAHAVTGVDILVTSNLYTAPAADYAAHMRMGTG